MNRPPPSRPAPVACLGVALFAGAQAGSAKPPPRRSRRASSASRPQTELTDKDVRIHEGGRDRARCAGRCPGRRSSRPRKGDYDWAGFDRWCELAARHGLQVLPFILEHPALAFAARGRSCRSTAPRPAAAWTAFLGPRSKRYGPGGEFWAEHAPGAVPASMYEPNRRSRRPLPIRDWQIWNEANFFYFAFPASPQRYAKLVKISSPAIKAGRPRRQGDPHRALRRTDRQRPARDARRQVPRSPLPTPGIKNRFDGIALHPYAVDAETLEELVEGIHDVAVETATACPSTSPRWAGARRTTSSRSPSSRASAGQVKQLRGLLRLPAREPRPAQPQAGLLVLLEGPPRTPATSATRSASSAKARASSRSRPGAPSSGSPAAAPGLEKWPRLDRQPLRFGAEVGRVFEQLCPQLRAAVDPRPEAGRAGPAQVFAPYTPLADPQHDDGRSGPVPQAGET